MDPYEGVLIALLGCFCVAGALIVLTVRQRARWQECRYRFFELRDDMVRLVAEGRVDTNSVVYSHTIELMNAMIRIVPRFTVSEVAQRIVKADEAAHRHLSWEKYEEAVSKADPEVAEVVGHFWAAVAWTLVQNSPSLRAYVWLRRNGSRLARWLSDCTKWMGKPPSWRAYRMSEEHQRAVARDRNVAHA